MDIEAIQLVILLAVVPSVLITTLIRKILALKDSYNVDATIIGYRHPNHTNTYKTEGTANTSIGFWPVVTYTKNEEEITTKIENLSLSLPEGSKVRLRLANNKNRYVPNDGSPFSKPRDLKPVRQNHNVNNSLNYYSTYI